MATRRRGRDGPGWRGGGGSGYGAETGWRGGGGSDERAYRRECGIAAAAQEPQSTSGSGRKRRMQRQSAPLDESWSGVNMWKSDGSQSRGAEVRVRAGGCAGARARPRMSAGRLRVCARCWPKRGRAGGRTAARRAGGRTGGRMGRWATPCDSCGMHARKRARRCTAYSAESPGPPPAPAEGG